MAKQGLSWPAVVILALVAATPRWAQAQDTAKHLLKLGATSPFELPASKRTAELRIPLLPDTGLEEGDSLAPPELYDMALNSRHDGAFREATKLEFDPAGGGVPNALKVQVDLDTLVEAGTYTVVVLLKATPKPAAPAPNAPVKLKQDTLTFQLVLPNAALTAVPVIKLAHEGFSPGDPPLSTVMVLHEATRRARLTNVTVEDAAATSQMKVTAVPRAPADGGASEPLTLPAGGRAEVPLTVSGATDVGTYSGKLRVSAPQLATPTEIAYEVTVRHPTWMIFVVLLVGLVIGQSLRVWLKVRIEDNAARAELLQQRRQLADEATRFGDTDYQQALGDIDRTLEAARPKAAADIKTAVEAARGKLATAQQKLEERRTGAVAKGSELMQLVDQAWTLPKRLDQAVLAARQAVRQAQGDTATNPRRAIDTLVAAKSTLQQELYKGAQEWKRALASLKPIGSEDVKLPKEMQDTLAPLVTELQEGVAGISDADPMVPSETLLKSVHQSTLKSLQFRDALRERIIPLARSVLEVIVESPKGADAINVLALEVRRCEERWTEDEDPLKAMGTLTYELRRLLATLAVAIKAAAASEASRAAAITLLEAGDYLEAARKTLVEEEALLGGPVPEGVVFSSPGNSSVGQVSLQATVPTPHAGGFLAPAPTRQLSLDELEVRTFRQLAGDRALRTAGTGLLLLVGGYLFFSKTFVGTPTDYATLFFWAFATDLTLEAIDKVWSPFKKTGT